MRSVLSFLVLTLLLGARSASAQRFGPSATLAAGHRFTCAVGGGGAVFCWGDNDSGQLGDGTRTARRAPVRVRGLQGVVEVACGGQHACARTAQGDVFCWGANGPGQAGDPWELFVFAPRRVGGLPPAARLFGGHFSTCATTTEGRLWCWGRSSSGQLATAPVAGEHGRPTPTVIPDVTGARRVVFSEGHACALDGAGDVKCWGDDDHRRAGGTGKRVDRPTRITEAAGAVDLAATNLATFARLKDGGFVYWGSRQGDRDFEPATGPRRDEGDVTALFASRYAAYVQRGGDGWKFPKSGPSPLLPVADLSWAVELVAGDHHACGRGRDGGVRCWGWNSHGVGDGTTKPQKKPVAIRLDAPDEQPPTRRGAPEPCHVEAPMDPQGPASQVAHHPLCGNGRRDVIGQGGGCPPCMPGRECRCAPMTPITEPCDGDDLGGATCASQGLGSGALACTDACQLDLSGCLPAAQTPPGMRVGWPPVDEAHRPTPALALAPRGAELGVAYPTSSGCGRAVFARFTAELSPGGASKPFGRPGDNRAASGAAQRYAVMTARVDDRGALAGAPELLAELDEGEWFVSGAAAVKGPALLLPRLNVSGSSIVSGEAVRLDLVEGPGLRTTLLGGAGVPVSRLVGWGDRLVAGWLWSGTRGGPARLGLATALPARAR